jgi:hypothetical protein
MADSNLDFTVDTSGMNAGIRRMVASIDPASKFSALAIGFEILRLSQMEVPHDKGTLQNSGTVQEIEDTVVVGYHTPYAARLHEHPEYHFQKGRKGKFLSDPIVRNARALGLKLADAFGEKLG